MAQGCNKTGQKGTNAMFVMSHDEIEHASAATKFFTYANPVVDYRPQKDDPHRIRIMAGGNLVNYDGNASVRTADLDTAKLHWNSVISTDNARYMCLDIKKIYLTAALKYFKYMKIPLALGWDYIQEISVRIVFHRESTIEISPRPIYPAIRPRICDYIRYNGEVCAKKTRFPPFFGKKLAQTFPARYPDRP
jgi:hypothetical protein